jgi:hypothetical protein
MTINPDGSWLMGGIFAGHTNTVDGTWLIKDGVFVMTLTNSPMKHGPPTADDVARYKIIHVDEHQFIYEDSGRTVTFTR